jgi:hypothetical protein
MEIDQAEWEKRISICKRKYVNFASRMVLDFGLAPVPIVELPTVQGMLELVGKVKFAMASDADLVEATKNIDEANARYKERKARKEQPKVADLLGEK